jgi:hypothetical protein
MEEKTELTIIDLLDNYVPDDTVVTPDNNDDTNITAEDFAPDQIVDVQTTENSSSVEDTVQDISEDESGNTVINNTSITEVSNTTNEYTTQSDDTQLSEGISDLGEVTQDLVGVTVEGNEQQQDLLGSIDATLRNQFEADEKQRRKDAIINETTPFDFLIGSDSSLSGRAGQNGGMLGDLAAAAAAAAAARGGNNKDEKAKNKKWKDQTTSEKIRSGARTGIKATGLAAIAALVGATAYDKLGGKLPEWVPFTGEDSEGNSDSPIADAAATAGLVGATYLGGKKVYQAYTAPKDVVETADTAEADKPKEVDSDSDKKNSVSNDTDKSPDKKFGLKNFNKAGLAGAAVTTAMTVSEIVNIRNDETLTQEQKNVATADLVGSTVASGGAAWAGGAVGAKLGASAGLLTGPAAPIMVPLLGVLGGIAGSMGAIELAENSGLVEFGQNLAVDVYETSSNLTDSADQLYKDTVASVDATVKSGKELLAGAGNAITNFANSLFTSNETTANAIVDNTLSTKMKVLESTSDFSMETYSAFDVNSTEQNSIGMLAKSIGLLPASLSPIINLSTEGLVGLFSTFGISLTDSIDSLKEEISEIGDALWDNIVGIFEGDSDTERALKDAQKKFDSNTKQESGIFSNFFGFGNDSKTVVVNNTAPVAPVGRLKPKQTYTATPLDPNLNIDSDYGTAVNVTEAGMVVNPDPAPVINNFVEERPVEKSGYGNSSKREQKRPEKASIKTVSRKDFGGKTQSGTGSGVPSLANTPVHMEDATLNLVNLGIL